MSKNPNASISKNVKSHKRTNSNSYAANNNSNNIQQTNNSQVDTSNSIYNNQVSNYSLLNNSKIPTANFENSVVANINNANTLIAENRTDDQSMLFQKVDCVGKIPTPRFGHTVTSVSPVKVVLFGGAIGDTRTFQFTSDTYMLNLMTKIWLKLESNCYLFI